MLHGGSAGGELCSGDARETRECDSGQCPELCTWSPWSACSSTCGPGLRTRVTSGEGCLESREEQEDCEVKECPDVTTTTSTVSQQSG